MKSLFINGLFPLAVLSLAMAAIVSGCALLVTDAPPYVISVPVCVAGPCDGYYRFAGIDFDFCNTGDATVSGLSVSCLVYDPVTLKNPFVGSNIVRCSFEGTVRPGDSVPLRISLDDHVHVAPNAPYIIDYFTVSKISYVDGSTWEDPAGAYYARGY